MNSQFYCTSALYSLPSLLASRGFSPDKELSVLAETMHISGQSFHEQIERNLLKKMERPAESSLDDFYRSLFFVLKMRNENSSYSFDVFFLYRKVQLFLDDLERQDKKEWQKAARKTQDILHRLLPFFFFDHAQTDRWALYHLHALDHGQVMLWPGESGHHVFACDPSLFFDEIRNQGDGTFLCSRFYSLSKWAKQYMGQQLYSTVKLHTQKSLLEELLLHYEEMGEQVEVSSLGHSLRRTEMRDLKNELCRVIKKTELKICLHTLLENTSRIADPKARNEQLFSLPETFCERERNFVLVHTAKDLLIRDPLFRTQSDLFLKYAKAFSSQCEDQNEKQYVLRQIEKITNLSAQMHVQSPGKSEFSLSTRDMRRFFGEEIHPMIVNSLHNLRTGDRSSQLFANQSTIPFGHTDGEIVKKFASESLYRAYSFLSYRLTTTESLFQRLYFETQGGPSRRDIPKPGDFSCFLYEEQGGVQGEMYMSIYRAIKTFCEQLVPEKRSSYASILQTLSNQMERALPLFLLCDKCVSNAHTISKAAHLLWTQMNESVPGDALIFPGGFSHHSVVCQIKKQDDGRYHLTVFNSGKGLERQYSRDGKFGNLRVRDIPQEKLSEEFFRCMFESVASGRQTDYFYTLLEWLGVCESDESYHYDQGRIGSCSYQSCIRWLKDQLGRTLYYHYRAFTLKGLLDMCRSHCAIMGNGAVMKMNRGASTRSVPQEIVEKVQDYAERCLQKIRRKIEIDDKIALACSLTDDEQWRATLFAIPDSSTISETILDDQDTGCLFLTIAKRLLEIRENEQPSRINERRIHSVFCLERSLHSVDRTKSAAQKAALLYENAKVYTTIGNFETAKKCLFQSLEAVYDMPSLRTQDPYLYQIIRMLCALKMVPEALEVALNIQSLLFQARAKKEIAYSYLSEGNLDQAYRIAMDIPEGYELYREEVFARARAFQAMMPSTSEESDIRFI